MGGIQLRRHHKRLEEVIYQRVPRLHRFAGLFNLYLMEVEETHAEVLFRVDVAVS